MSQDAGRLARALAIFYQTETIWVSYILVALPAGSGVFQECTNHILVFDVGGSHIACSVFRLRGMTISAPRSLPVQSSCSPADFVEAFASLARNSAGPAALNGIAVAMPNPFDYERGISYMQHKYQQLYGADIRQALSAGLKLDPARICFLNDAEAFLSGELHQGAATGVDRVIGITLGTGVGSAFAVGGKIVGKGDGVPPGGEIWNLPYSGGIVENFVSTLAIERIYERLTGASAEVREIARLAPMHFQARQTFEYFGKELGKVLSHLSSEFAPDRIVLGGGISRAGKHFLPAAEEVMANLAIPLRVSVLFEGAPLLGAGIRWMQKHESGRRPQTLEGNDVVEEK
jgi:glucokinase